MKQSGSWMIRALGIALTGAMSLILATNISAQTLFVGNLQSQYTTWVWAAGGGQTPITRTNTSQNPFTDEADLVTDGVSSHAMANAGLFSVSDGTYRTSAQAQAVSQYLFSPVADGIGTLNIQIQLGGLPYASALVSLQDLTLNSTLWNYHLNGLGPDGPQPVPSGDNIPWTQQLVTANFNVDTSFLASDQYELILAAGSDAGDDSESVNIQLSGIQAIPEPSSLAMLLAGCGALVAFGWRRKK